MTERESYKELMDDFHGRIYCLCGSIITACRCGKTCPRPDFARIWKPGCLKCQLKRGKENEG